MIRLLSRLASMSFYAVRCGRKPGVYTSWSECEDQVKKFTGAKYKKFASEAEALAFINAEKSGTSTESEAASGSKSAGETVKVYINGQSIGIRDTNMCGGVGVFWGPDHANNVSERLPGRHTKNGAEILAAVKAVQQAKAAGISHLTLLTDNDHLINCQTKWVKKWKTNGWKVTTGGDVANKEELQQLDEASNGIDITWASASAKSGDTSAEEAVKLAKQGAKLPAPAEDSQPSSEEEKKPAAEEKKSKATKRSADSDTKPRSAILLPDDYDINSEAKKARAEGRASVYTDGCCICNGKDNPTAGVGVYWGPGHEDNLSERLPGRQTNNRAEIYAAMRALLQAKAAGISDLTIYTDSQFLINCQTKWVKKWKENGWKASQGKEVINREELELLGEAETGIKVTYVHVAGHSGVDGNEAADRLANQGAAKPLPEGDVAF